ncbi:MAG: signal recognition particle protein [Clostridia bacterium]|nr:signal recognition particle protein [Clostridia bacterium]
MAFENLGEKLSDVFKRLKGKGKLTEKDIKEAMREVKLALLEADVNFKVVKNFISRVSEKAVGQEILESLTPAQQLIKVVRDELVELMGNENERLEFSKNSPSVFMMCGLQGAGKTTACGKLALHIRKTMGKRPLMVACDIYRPAAIKQLQVLGSQIDIPVFTVDGEKNPAVIAKKAVEHAKIHGNDPVILDTAGRLHIDEVLMEELVKIKETVSPDEILLVIDAMIGQDAVNVAEHFNSNLDITGVILSKLDGDTRGGAALSVKEVTGKSIKFASVGEKLSDLEPFYPDRMAGRILGMGDVMTLIDKAQDAIDEKEARELEEKIKKQTLGLDDFLAQLQQIKKMGSITQIMKMIPGVDKKMLDAVDEQGSEKKLVHIEAIIRSMTPQERQKPQIIGASRKVRIAKGSGTRVQDVNELLRQFESMKQMMKQFSNPKQQRMMKRMKKMSGRFQ